MEVSQYWEANRWSAAQEHLYFTEFENFITVTVTARHLPHINPGYTLQHYLYKLVFNITLPPMFTLFE